MLGGFSGKVGIIVGAIWRGKDIIRSLPKPSQKAPIEKQVQQQLKFALTIAFLTPLNAIQSRFYVNGRGAKSRINLALSYILYEAVQIVAGLPELMYNKVLITKGDLTGFQNANITAASNEVLNLTWTNNADQGNASIDEQINIVSYSSIDKAFAIFENIATRNAESISINLPSIYSGQSMQVWAYINSSQREQACNSLYLGEVQLQ
ncbi:DUF6266 family protein [Soonwooa sp.]|uniref:DUF6266 family protein n=1 Tax=Soonwooa sp. TaxID=1938592 RepID=UPI0028B0ACFA|nr:DUF6266 family protein [Soonwooa sp.]